MAATFLLQTQFDLVIAFGIASAAAWMVWGVLSFLLRRYDAETVREVALAVYPLSALIALTLGVILGFWLEELLLQVRHQNWTLIAAGALLAVVMIIRCLDIRWMRSAEDLRHLKSTVGQ